VISVVLSSLALTAATLAAAFDYTAGSLTPNFIAALAPFTLKDKPAHRTRFRRSAVATCASCERDGLVGARPPPQLQLLALVGATR
jgi:hypothetical protein